MGRIGHGYGSEWHPLRYLGRHRNLLDRKIKGVIGCGQIEWFAFGFDVNSPWHDAEWKGLDFLQEDFALQTSWGEYWPRGAGIHNWDAVAQTISGGKAEWILVEAKTNLEELKSECQARNKESLQKIRAAFDATKAALGVRAEADWMRPYYQYCNRVAALHFLASHGVVARSTSAGTGGMPGEPAQRILQGGRSRYGAKVCMSEFLRVLWFGLGMMAGMARNTHLLQCLLL